MLVVASILVVVVSIVTFYFKWSWLYWKRRNVPHSPVDFPFGNAKELITQNVSFGEAFARVYEEYKAKGQRYCGYYFLTKPVLVATDVELIKNVMTKDFQFFTDHFSYVNEKVDPLSGHLFSLKGQRWRNLRAKLTPTFTSGKMKMMFPTLVDCSRELVNIMENCADNRNVLDVKDVVGRFTTDIIGSCAFGIDCNSLFNPESEFRKYGVRVFEDTVIDALKNFTSFSFPEILHLFNVAITKRDVGEFFMNVVRQTVNYREANGVIRKDFMQLLLQLKDSNDASALTMEELAAQAFVFFLAGFETSSTTLTFCFYELATNLDIQRKLRKEIREVLQRHDSQITYDSLTEMVYMDQCIYETLRKYPPVPILNRECTKAYKLPNSELVLEKGTPLFIPILGIQRDPVYYPDPSKFDPERFSPEQKEGRHPFAWLPFGEGPRVCIGMRFGLMQTKVALAVMLTDYLFTLNQRTDVPLKMDSKSIITSAKGGVWLNVARVQ
ncbi:hypothetical protein PPYR_02856 [Photinus pyralis]|uniref:Cytochrome P450 n=1 Tax=Photinus pyralis TaxID=7054 RepID=A0A5N4A180_PHOPY|nr:probable cytochrome P450 6a13 [Photinus pyralis]KAB0791056.1 hypothetical protein PPYR_02856 [Photinus pyralis]